MKGECPLCPNPQGKVAVCSFTGEPCLCPQAVCLGAQTFFVHKLFTQVYSASPSKLRVGHAWPCSILPTILIKFSTLVSCQESERGWETCLCCEWHSQVSEPRPQEPKRKPMSLTSEPHCYPPWAPWPKGLIQLWILYLHTAPASSWCRTWRAERFHVLEWQQVDGSTQT